MVEAVLTSRTPLAHRIVPGRHGATTGAPGVRFRAVDTVVMYGVLAFRERLPELRQALAGTGVTLPDPGRVMDHDGCQLLWAGPDQWTIVSVDAAGDTAAERLAAACRPHALVAAQGDARAVIELSGSQARATLAKLIGVDLHPRMFGPGQTVLTPAGVIPVQLWQTDTTPTFMVAVPRSFAEDFWDWLAHSAAQYGYETTPGDATHIP